MNDKEIKELLYSLKIIIDILYIIAEELERISKDDKKTKE